MSAEAIRELNDQLRVNDRNGRIVITSGILNVGGDFVVRAREAVRAFNAFDEDNDPNGEHDFGSLVIDGYRLMFKIDYYDLQCEFGSPDPSNAAVTTRVMTILLAEEY
ncbi:MAG TPA: DUF3768 domain-containing protein [Caulobacteraceae bacterium]|nr:DUF3768 domain-containing protein [Caulobacteraceae bacterium]